MYYDRLMFKLDYYTLNKSNLKRNFFIKFIKKYKIDLNSLKTSSIKVKKYW